MKYLFTLSFIVSLYSFGHGQQLPEFAPLGATWHVAYLNYGWPLHVDSRETTVLEEVMLKGQMCKKINWLPSGGTDSSFIYQDGLKIYSYDPLITHDWVLWLDFSTEKDSSWIWYRTDYNYHDWQTGQKTGRQDTITITVFKKGDTTINGFSLPYMDVISSLTHRSPYESCSYGYIDTSRQRVRTTRITWALGPEAGGLYLGCQMIDVPGQYQVVGKYRCYEDSTIGLTTNFEHPKVLDCETDYYPNGQISIDPENLIDVSLSPNPVADVFRLNFEVDNENANIHVELLDLLGKSQMDWEFRFWNGSSEFDISSLESGIYFLKVSQKGKLLASEKIIKY